MFPDNIEILRGRMLAPGEDGIVLNEQVVRRLERTGEVRVQPGETRAADGHQHRGRRAGAGSAGARRVSFPARQSGGELRVA